MKRLVHAVLRRCGGPVPAGRFARTALHSALTVVAVLAVMAAAGATPAVAAPAETHARSASSSAQRLNTTGTALGKAARVANVSASATSGLFPNELINYGSGKCIGTYGGDLRAGSKVVQFSCYHDISEHPDQYWYVSADGDYHEIRVFGSAPTGASQCLALEGGNTIIGWQLEIYNCNGNPDQQWRLTAHGSSWVIWNMKSPNLIIGVGGGSTADLAPVVLWRWEAHPDQSWVIPGEQG
jgi:alpha-galactosidase